MVVRRGRGWQWFGGGVKRRDQCVVEDEYVVGGPDPLCHIPLPSSAPNTPQRGGVRGASPEENFWFQIGD